MKSSGLSFTTNIFNMTSSNMPFLGEFSSMTSAADLSQTSEASSTKTSADLPQTPELFAVTSSDPTRSPELCVNMHTDNIPLWFVLDVALAVFIVAGNSLTLAAVGTTVSLQVQANMYVVSLALADMLAAVYLLLDAAWVLPATGAIFDDNEGVCLLKDAVLYLCLSSSMITMICIAVDKLLFVVTPFLHRRTVTGEKTLAVIAACWLASILYGSAVSYANVFDQKVGCQALAVLKPDFVLYGNTTPVALAVIVIAGCYLEIVRVVVKQRRKIQALNQACGVDRDSYKKSLMLFLTVTGVFVVCWAPFVIQGFLMYTSHSHHDFYRGFLRLALLNCGLNFFIYAWKNKDFKAAYKRLLLDSCKSEHEVC